MKSQTGGSCRLDSAHARLLQAQRAGAVGTMCNGCEVEGGCSGTVEYNRCRSETIERCRQARQARWQFNLLRIKQVQRHSSELLNRPCRPCIPPVDPVYYRGVMAPAKAP